MSFFTDNIRAGASGASTGYEIERSLMFNNQRQTDLRRTPAAQGDRRTLTISTWLKFNRSGWEPADGDDHYFYSAVRGSNNPQTYMGWKGNRLYVEMVVGGSYEASVATERRFRDVSGWVHVVVHIDTTQSTASNRVRFYFNGVEETNKTGMNVGLSYPSQDFQTAFGTNEAEQVIGEYHGGGGSHNFDGYMAEYHYIDGATKAPTEFGEYNDDDVWIPKEYTGTYGSSDVGFYLKFTDDSNTTATTMGKDYSGNSNNWTPSNFNVSDISADTPTNNFCTMNHNDKSDSTQLVVQYGGRRPIATHGFRTVRGTFGVTSGKWYWEARLETWEHSFIGITSVEEDIDGTTRGAETNFSAMIRQNTGNLRTNGSDSSYGNSQSDGDILGFALDMDNGKFYISENGTYFNSGDPANQTNPGKTGLTKRVCPAAAPYDNKSCYYNFGADDTFNGAITSQGNTDGNGNGKFKYAPPSGFLALCSKNLPEPTIPEGDKHFRPIIYTGDGNSNLEISDLDFQPDFVWIKRRDGSNSNQLFDSLRGATKELLSNTNSQESTESNSLKSFDNDGFTVGDNGGVNTSGGLHVAWCWNAGGSTATNNDGSISSQVRANQTSGFSIVTYTGNGNNATVGHGLGVKPTFVIAKRRSGGNADWFTFIDNNLGNTKNTRLNLTDSPFTTSNIWNNTDPTSSVVNIGTSSGINANGDNYLMYCFASVEGYQEIGRYVGNGSSQGTFINTGFRPAFVLIRRIDSSGNWILMDQARNPSNPVNERLRAEVSNQRSTSYNTAYFFSNGFQLQDQYDGSWNNNDSSYFYLAIARHPYKTSNAR
tara:strand:+ start:355 stop:2820 length:2466 start_codon:yes stop_codon:yes gene_type:complete